MPRLLRSVAVGLPHHVVHRGNNKTNIFFDDEDRVRYFGLLKKYTKKWESSILAYCLMTNHVHLLTRPNQESSLFKMMQGVSQCYAQYINQKYKRTGRLWESRFYSSIVGEERYLWGVVRYIEQNPVRANIVKQAQDYQFSSAKAHLEGKQDDLIGEELFDEWQRKEYAKLLEEDISKERIERIRSAVKAGRPFGSEAFLQKMEETMDRRFMPKSPGRPKYRKD